jgi:TPR repeat protein
MTKATIKSAPKEICTLGWIQFSALIGGPLGASYLISKNFNTFGKHFQAKKSILYGLIATIILIALPDEVVNKLPHFSIPIISILLISLYANKLQKIDIEKSLETGYKKFSRLKIIGVSILSLLITLIITFSTFFIFEKSPDSDIQNDLGVKYHEGIDVPKNDKLAAETFRKSAEQGNAIAQLNLGYAYHMGQGVAQDDAEAVVWYRKAAEQGNAQAQSNLALAYHSGIGIAKDDNEAKIWLQKAAANGNSEAREVLQSLTETN